MANSQALAALLGNGGQDTYQSGNPIEMLQQCINDLHQLMQAMPDAKHTQMIGQALSILLGIQTELAQAQPDQRQQLLQSLGG